MSDKQLKYPGSKWNKHVVMTEESALQRYLPHTMRLSKQTFNTFIDQYPVIFIKPILGGGGRGILRITAKGKGYELKSTIYRKYCFNRHHLYKQIKNKCRQMDAFIIQKGISLLHIHDRPIDFRVLMIKDEDEWKYVGTMGKIAAKNKHVTNHCRGGSSITLHHALQRTAKMKKNETASIEKKIKQLAMLTATTLNASYKNITELGLDIAIDQSHKLWIIEANSKPHFELFKDHDDPELYRFIRHKIKTLRTAQNLK